MYTYESGGYCTDGDRQQLETLVQNGVQYAFNNDMYVIIDWHVLNDGNPNRYSDVAKAFFCQKGTAVCLIQQRDLRDL